jgi:hypothetical protein
VVNDFLDDRSRAPDFEHWESPETRVRWERGLAIVAGMIGVVLVFFLLLSAIPLTSDDDESQPVRGSQAAQAQAQTQSQPADISAATAAPTPASTQPPGQRLAATSRAVPNVRRQPNLTGPVVMNLRQGQQVDVVGRSPDNQWLQILNPDRPAEKLWVSADMLDVTGDPRTLPEVRE